MRIPKPIIALLRDMQEVTGKSVEEFTEASIVEAVESELAAGTFTEPQHLLEKYNLEPTFKAYNVLAPQY